MPSTSLPPTPLLPTSANSQLLPSQLPKTPYSPSFPSELPTPKSASFKSLSLQSAPEGVKTPMTPPNAYFDFLKTSIVMRTPTSATFRDVPRPPTSAPLASSCACPTSARKIIKKPAPLKRSGTDSSSSSANSSRESSCESDKPSNCCSSNPVSNYSYFPPPTPYTPFTPNTLGSGLRTPLSAVGTGSKRLRIPPSPAFSPNYKSSFESPLPMYSATPRTPITEEDEEEEESNSKAVKIIKDSSVRNGTTKKIVTVRPDVSGMTKTARMKLMAAPKGKKRKTE